MHDWTETKINTKKVGDQHYNVYINGEMAGTVKKTIVYGRTQMWRHSHSRQNFDTKKEATEALVERWTA